jgi:hypothetical protein
MVAMFQITTEWSGGVTGTGYSNMFFVHSDPPSTGAATAAANVRTFWSSVGPLIPNGISLQVMPTVRVIEDTDGSLDSIIDITAPAVVTGGGAGVYAKPVGSCVNWITATVHGTRRMVGRTFVVPLFASAWQADGSLLDAYRTTISTAASTLIASGGPQFVVWGRPRDADPDHVPPITARAGLSGPVVSSRVPDKAIVLTSRRD